MVESPAEPTLEPFRSALDRIAARLAADGPTEALLEEAEEVAASLRDAGPHPAEAIAEARALAADLREGLDRRRAIAELEAEPVSVAPPFAEVLERRRRFEDALRPPAEAGAPLREWIHRERERKLGELEALRDKCSLAATFLLELAEREARGFRKWQIEASDFGLLVRQLAETRSALLEVFGRSDIREELIGGLEAEVARRAETVEALASLDSRARLLAARLEGIDCPSLWTPEAEGETAAALREISEELLRLEEAEPDAPLGAPREGLRAATRAAERLGEERALWVRAVESFRARDLATADRVLEDLLARRPDRSGAGRVLEASRALRRGFDALLGRLDLERARREFEEAVKGLSGIDEDEKELSPIDEDEKGLSRIDEAAAAGPSTEAPEVFPLLGYAAACRDRLGDLERSVQDMAPVGGGEALIPERPTPRRVAVEPFFIDRYEASVGEYREFVAVQGSVRDFAQVKDLWPDEETFRRCGTGAALSPPYFAEAPGPDPRLPVEEVSYHQARAFLRSRGKDLPRLAEWFLAARGRPVSGVYPFDVPSLEIHSRAQAPVPIDQSGEARGFPARRSVHHLAGNVAEWCLAEGEGAGRAPLVGGRYADTDLRLFSGERVEVLPLSARSRGYGFRGAIRPRAFFEGLIPVGME